VGVSSDVMPLRQMGQVLCSLSQAEAQVSWNQWLQGRTTTSSFRCTSSMQTEHSPEPSGPSIFSSSFFFGRAAIASGGAGPGALEL
jgi:hypothetical protein